MIIAEYIFYAFFALFPFLTTNYFLYGPTSFRSVCLIATASTLGIIYSIWLFRNNRLVIPKALIFLVFLVYFIFLIISSVFGLDFSTSFWSTATRSTGIWYFLNLGFFMFVLWQVVSVRSKRDRLIIITVFSSALYSLLSFFGPQGLNWIFKSYPNDAFTFGNSTFAGIYLFGAFLLSVYYLLQADKKKWWMYLLPIILLINPNILRSNVWFGDFSSGIVGDAKNSAYVILLSLVGLVVVWSISKIRKIQTKKLASYSVFGLGLMIAVGSAFSLFSSEGYLRQVYLSRSTIVRPLAWEMSFSAIRERPYLGWGSDNFERVFEANYDNRILQEGESWLDRAHNVVIDQLVDNGAVGFGLYVLVYLVIILSMIYVALNSPEKNDRILAAVLAVYFPLHFMELQTAFDTSISYVMLALMAVLAAVLYQKTRKNSEWKIDGSVKHSLAILLVILVVWSLGWGWVPFVRAQIANSQLRTVGSSEKRIPLYPTLLGGPIDQHAFLWRTSTDFQRGIADNTKVLEDPDKVESLKKEAAILENGYREYIKKRPTHFRAHLNLADILIYQRLFDVNKLAEAQIVLDEAIGLVPQSPQPYWMKAVAYVYVGKFDQAKEYAQKGLAINPKIVESSEVVDYVEESIKTFPKIDLFFFRQI